MELGTARDERPMTFDELAGALRSLDGKPVVAAVSTDAGRARMQGVLQFHEDDSPGLLRFEVGPDRWLELRRSSFDRAEVTDAGKVTFGSGGDAWSINAGTVIVATEARAGRPRLLSRWPWAAAVVVAAVVALLVPAPGRLAWSLLLLYVLVPFLRETFPRLP